MKWMEQQSKYENMIYVALWGMLFAAPILSLYIRSISDASIPFQWSGILMVWQSFGIYLLLFLLHNFLLAPLLIYRQKRMLYIALTGSLLAAFILFQCTNKPDDGDFNPRMEKLHGEQRPPLPRDFNGDEQHPEEPRAISDNEPQTMEDRHQQRKEYRHMRHARMRDRKGPHLDRMRRQMPPAIIGEHDIIAIVILILMLGANLGIKGYFRSRKDHKKLAELEKQNLEQQLEYLKYQINPHFFMNTLNNIHALVDIDPEKAQQTILELSKMMRFVLYEGNKQGVPLSREFEFIRTYIQLMRLRYTDKVKITVDLPTEAPDMQLPPLMLITFIENAFKHGVSYQHESVIDIRVGIEHQRLRFKCRNTKAEKPDQEKGGVGLANVKQRLNLLYDNNYTLTIQDEADIYNVELDIPLTRNSNKELK